MCEFCGSDPCQCDRNDNDPVDCGPEVWAEIYADPECDLDHDHSMDA